MAAIEVTAAPLRKLCFMVLNSGTSDLGDCATPLMHALTASAMKGDDHTCLEAGMDAYLTKPIDIDRLASMLESMASPATGMTA